jgi:Domain of unknown function (DUF3601)
MAASNTLRPGQRYVVIREFADYDQQRHAVGETWTFIGQSGVPHEDGVLLEIRQQGQLLHFRMQWRAECQGVVMDNFLDYVRPLS